MIQRQRVGRYYHHDPIALAAKKGELFDMTYEKPEVIPLASAIECIKRRGITKQNTSAEETDLIGDFVPSYEDWE
jgi:hypothetical protein